MSRTQVRNLNKVIKELRELGGDIEQEVDLQMQITSQDIELKAKQKAPVDKGFLRNQIKAEKVKPLNYKVIANAPYSAYMEFGTGGLVEVPNEMRDIASEFRGNGVKKINLRPQPFLYPAFVEGRRNLIKDLRKLLKDMTK